MPEEFERFKQVNEFFRTKTREIYKNRGVISSLLKTRIDQHRDESDDQLEILKKFNCEIDHIRNSLKK